MILFLDLSTSCTGWAVFSQKGVYQNSGFIKNTTAGLSKAKYPWKALARIKYMVDFIGEQIFNQTYETVVIEEVNLGKNRISQKTLDALHFFLLEAIKSHEFLGNAQVHYIDTEGATGWRGKSGLSLSTNTKEIQKHNRKVKKENKDQGKAKNKNVITKKVLAVRYANAALNLQLDEEYAPHHDQADAVCMGLFWHKEKA